MDEQVTYLFLFLFLTVAVVAVALIFYFRRQQRRRVLIDSLLDGVFALDPQGEVREFNPAAQKLLALSADKIKNQPLMKLLPVPPDLFRDRPAEVQHVEFTLGEEANQKHYEIRLSARLSGGGDLVGWLAVMQDITEAKEVEQDLLDQKQLFENLVAVARATAERPTLEATLQSALDVAASLTDARWGSLFLFDENNVVTHSILARRQATLTQRRSLVGEVMDKGLAGWVSRHREPALIAETLEDDRWLTLPDSPYEVRSVLGVPILNKEEVLGILTLQHSAPYHFDEEDLRLMLAAADQIALALQNARIYDHQQRQAQQQTALYEVLSSVGRHLEPEAAAESAVEVLARLTGWPAVAILTPGETNQQLVVQAAAGFLAETKGHKYEMDKNGLAQSIRKGELHYVRDVEAEPNFLVMSTQSVSQLVIPLRRREQVLGVLTVQGDRLNAFSEDEQQLASSMADAVALALDNARFHAAMRKHAADLNALYTVNRMIGRSLVLDEMLAKTLYSTLTSLGFGFGFIALVGEGNGRLTLASERSLPADFLNQLHLNGIRNSFAGYVLEQERAVVLGDIEGETVDLLKFTEAAPTALNQLTTLEVRSCAGIPLIHQKEVLGVMCLFSRHARLFSAEDEALQVTIGQQIALGLSHTRLFKTIADERGLLQALISSSRDGLIMVGAENQRVLVANQPALEMLRSPERAEAWIGRSLLEVIRALKKYAPPVVELVLQEMRRLRDGLEGPGEGEFELGPRTIFWLNLPVLANNVSLGRLIVLRDVTQERALERVRDDLIHTMVHDLRNPLSSIYGSLEFLEYDLETILTADQSQVLEIARNNSQHMINIVSSILDINRLESGQMPLNKKPIALLAFAKRVMQAQMPLAKQKRITLSSEMPPNLPLTWADAGLLERVLQNLLDNALKFTPEGGEIVLKAWPEDGERPQLHIAVCDNGVGMPPEVAKRIFQKFTTGRREESGSGLGLTFCKMVVEAHGGRIWVESEEEEGTTFTFTLPPLPADI